MISASCLNHLERSVVLFHLDSQTMVQVFQNDISRQAQIQDPSHVMRGTIRALSDTY